jgi:hypothetical protein
MITIRPVQVFSISCLAVVFWLTSVSVAGAFFNDREASPDNQWGGAIVNVLLDATAPLTTPDSFVVSKHPQSLDLFYRLSVVDNTPATCADVTLELVGSGGTTTANVASFPVVDSTTLGEWTLRATQADAAVASDCELTMRVKAWAVDSPEEGFSDSKDFTVLVSPQPAPVLLLSPLTVGGGTTFKQSSDSSTDEADATTDEPQSVDTPESKPLVAEVVTEESNNDDVTGESSETDEKPESEDTTSEPEEESVPVTQPEALDPIVKEEESADEEAEVESETDANAKEEETVEVPEEEMKEPEPEPEAETNENDAV